MKKMLCTSVLVLAMGTFAFGDVVAGTDFDTDVNLISYTVTTSGGADPVTWGGGDWFGVGSYGAWPQAAGMPFSVADDSFFSVSSNGVNAPFPTDVYGMIESTYGANNSFFSGTDIVNGANPGGTATATWEFNISGFTDLAVSVDMSAMGDFETSDTYDWTYSIDGAPAAPLFTSFVNDQTDMNYTMELGTLVTHDDPMGMNGTLLNDVFQTITASLTGSGSTLTLTLVGASDGGTEAYAADNIVITGIPEPATLALLAFGGLALIRRR